MRRVPAWHNRRGGRHNGVRQLPCRPLQRQHVGDGLRAVHSRLSCPQSRQRLLHSLRKWDIRRQGGGGGVR